MNFGIAVTELTSRLGILSRKASMRLAEETGIKMVDKTREVGRALNKQEIEEVFAQTLPKRCRPTIVTTPEEGVPYMVNTGYSPEVALSQLRTPGLGAANIPNGMSRRPIWVPMDLYPAMVQNGAIAHELEHALETNCRPKMILKRKGIGILKLAKKFDKVFGTSLAEKYLNKETKNRTETLMLEMQLQRKNGTFIQIVPNEEFNPSLGCTGTKKALAGLQGKTEEEFSQGIRETIREGYMSPEVYASDAKRKYKFLNLIMDIEKPAYTTQGKVEQYAYKLGEKEISKASGTALVYDEAQKIAKADRKLYRQNKSNGTLELPERYNGKKDLYRLAQTKDDRKVLYSVIKNMNEEERAALFCQLRWYPEVKIQDIKAFLDATTVNGKSIYSSVINRLGPVNPQAFSNPDFMEIAMLSKDGMPLYGGVLHKLSKKSPESIKKFLEIAKSEQSPKLNRFLAEVIDHPQFESLQNIAKIQIEGENLYAGRIYKLAELPQKEIAQWENKLVQAAKEGKDLNKDLDEIIETSRRGFDEDFGVGFFNGMSLA